MSKAILFVSFFMFLSAYGQEKGISERKLEKIKKYSNSLTGNWKFIGLYNNGKFIESEINHSTLRKIDGKSVHIYLQSTDSGYVKKKFVDGKLILVEKSDYGNLALQFDENGKGSYSELDYAIDPDFEELIELPHAPQPKILHRNGKYVIKMTEMLEQYELRFRLKNNILCFKRKGEKRERRYEKIKKHAL